MQYWKENFIRSCHDAVSISGAQPLATVVFTVVVFVMSFKFLGGLVPEKGRREDVLKVMVGLCFSVLCALVVFVFCVLFVAPVQIFNGQKEAVTGYTNKIENLNSEIKRLNDDVKRLKDDPWKDLKHSAGVVARHVNELAGKCEKSDTASFAFQNEWVNLREEEVGMVTEKLYNAGSDTKHLHELINDPALYTGSTTNTSPKLREISKEIVKLSDQLE